MKLRHISAVAVVAVLLPFAASALSIDDLQAQIASLLAQVQQLKAQLVQLQTGNSNPNPVTLAPSRICPTILRQLSRGANGNDVMSLQAYLGVNQTGYFGAATANAVVQFQSSEGLSQVGSVGPQTRAAFARRCGGSNQNFTASPTSGAAPLTVSFSTGTTPATNSATYTIDFGDGTSGEMQSNGIGGICVVGTGGPCNGYNTLIVSHTYASAGTYTATLYKNTCPAGADCLVGPLPVGTATIYVGTTNGGAPSISGLDAPTSLSIGQSGTWTVHASAPSGTQLSYSVLWGDESILAQINTFAGAARSVQASATFTHAYAQAGTYQPVFTVSSGSASAQTSASVLVGGSTVVPPCCKNGADLNASPTSGNAPLSVSFTASGLTVGSTYVIEYGDGSNSGPLTPNGNCSSTNIAACGIAGASHTYATNGSYTAVLEPYVGCMWTNPRCMIATQALDMVTITVGSTITDSATFSAYPTSGDAPLAVRFTATDLSSSGSYSVDFGDGTSGQGSCSITSTSVCELGTLYFNHTYTSVGTYTAKLRNTAMACAPADCNVISTVTITVGTNFGN